MTLLAVRVALDPTPTQARALRSHAGAARVAFNWGLARVKANLDQREAEKTYGVRHEAPCHIPGAAGRNSEGGSWARRLTRIRKVKGTRACRDCHRPRPGVGAVRWMSPRDMAKAKLPESQSPVMQLFIHRKQRLKPVPRPVLVYLVGGCTFRAAGDAQ
jgi:hypothetical protein